MIFLLRDSVLKQSLLTSDGHLSVCHVRVLYPNG